MSISERLKEERKKSGMNQTEFGQLGGVTKKTQMLYESGERTPDAIYLRRISCIGADVQYIVIGLPSANLMEAMLTDKFVKESSLDEEMAVLAKIDDMEKVFKAVADDLSGKKSMEASDKAALADLLAEPGYTYASLSARETALVDNYRNAADERDKSAIERVALMASRAAALVSAKEQK